jgi:hypothetical protein
MKAHDAAAELKPHRLFSWTLNARICWKHIPGALVHCRKADSLLMLDRSGWSWAWHLRQLFQLLGDKDAEERMEEIYQALRAQCRLYQLESSHRLPMHRYQVEIVSLTDPETFVLQPEEQVVEK